MGRLIPAVAVSLTAIMSTPALARDRAVMCRLEVKGHAYLNGKCNYSPSPDGSFSIGTSDKRPSTYFACVNKNEDGPAEAYWNEDPGSRHAHSSLGTVKRSGACWVNAKARICAK